MACHSCFCFCFIIISIHGCGSPSYKFPVVVTDTVCTMNPPSTPEIALCPRCLCPLNIRQCYMVNFCLPIRPPYPPTVAPNLGPSNDGATYPLPSSAHQQNTAPAPPPEPTNRSQPPEHEENHTAHGESRRASASSSSSLDSAFTQFSINSEFVAELQAAEEAHFSQQPFRASSLPRPPTSSPSTESSLTLSAAPTSSPSTESSLTLSTSDEPPSIARRWVVFRGRTPGIYASS